jgi:hypothetical protein
MRNLALPDLNQFCEGMDSGAASAEKDSLISSGDCKAVALVGNEQAEGQTAH